MSPPRKSPSWWNRCRHGLRAFLVLFLLAVVLLSSLGLPGPFASWFLQKFAPKGVMVACEGIRFRPSRGFIVLSPRIWSPLDHVTPIVSAHEVSLRPDFPLRRRTGSLRVSDAQIRSDLGLWADDLTTRQPILLDSIQANARLEKDRIVIERASLRFAEFRIQADGVLPLSALSGSPHVQASSFGPSMSRLAATLAPHVALVERFRFDRAPEVWVRFEDSGDTEDPLRVCIDLSHQGDSNLRGAELAAIEAKILLSRTRISLEFLRLRDAEGRSLDVEGWIEPPSDKTFVHIRNTLPRFVVEAVSPVSLSRIFQKHALRIEGRSDFDLRFGPSLLVDFGDHFEGTVSGTNAFFRDAAFPRLDLSLRYQKGVLFMDSLKGEVGLGAANGPVEGSLFYDTRSEAIRLKGVGAFKPEALVTLVGSRTEGLLREWEFPGSPPRFRIDLSHAGGDSPVWMSLEAEAEEVRSRGALFDSANLRVRMTDQEIRIEDFYVTRGVEIAQGRIIGDLDFERLDLDVMSTLHLPVLAPILGREVVDFLRPYRIRGSNWVRATGRLDLRDNPAHPDNDLRGEVNLNNIIWQWVKVDNLSCQFLLQGSSLHLDDIRGSLSEGSLQGDARFDGLFGDTPTFSTHLDVRDTDLFQVITAATDTDDTPYTGRMDLRLHLEGGVPPRDDEIDFDSWNGEGSLHIQEGTLFRIPLLLGLSRILSRVVPGFGYASQTDFHADFRIDNGIAHSENLFLSGRLLSIAGEGRYALDGRIRANLRVQLLNQGVLSDALRLLLWPIRKLIEIQLTGTLDHPDWQPRNLPKELFGK